MLLFVFTSSTANDAMDFEALSKPKNIFQFIYLILHLFDTTRTFKICRDVKTLAYEAHFHHLYVSGKYRKYYLF